MSGKATPEVMAMLETRNYEGKTAFFTAVECDRIEIVNFLLDNYPGINVLAQDTFEGNIPLHCACKNNNMELVQKLFELDNKLCLATNFKG